jgi:two-component system sensor histidine kinase KdpD
VASSGQSVYSPDLDADERVVAEVRHAGSNQGIRSYFAAPVIVGGDVVGVMQVDSAEPDAFSEDQRALLATLAPLLGAAIQNARTYTTELETLQQMDEIEALRSDFISIVTHELRTPLTSLLGFAELVARDPENLPPSFAKHQLIDGISSSVARLDHHVTELEHLARHDGGSLEITPRATDLGELLTAAGVAAEAETKRSIQVEVEEGLPPALVDPDRLIEALSELIDNAAKFSKENTPITIRARSMGDRIEIAVIDEGVGLSGPMADKVLDRFAQAEAPLVRGAGGLGLGLPMARALVERMGGALHMIPGTGGGPRVAVRAGTVADR